MLIAYFSASGTTAKTAEKLAELLDAKIYEIEPEIPYSPQDLDWTDLKSRSSIEMKNEKSRPSLKSKAINLNQQETILLGFPNW